MTNPMVSGGYSSQQDAQYQGQSGGGSSRFKKAVTGAILLGGVGAGLGATVFAPKKVKTVDALLECDTFESTLKINEKSPKEAQDAKKVLEAQKKAMDAAKKANDTELKKLFKEETTLSVDVNDAMKNFNPKYSTLAEAENRLKYLEEKAAKAPESANPVLQEATTPIKGKKGRLSYEEIMEILKEKEGKKLAPYNKGRKELIKLLKENGYENAKEIVEEGVGSRLYYKNLLGTKVSPKLSDSFTAHAIVKSQEEELVEVLKMMGHEDPENAAKGVFTPNIEEVKKARLAQSSVKEGAEAASKNAESVKKEIQSLSHQEAAELKDLKEKVGFLKHPDTVKDGKLSREAYMAYIESKNPALKVPESAENAFKSVEKFITKKRGAGALKIGAIGAAAGILLGVLFGKSKKD